MRARPQDGVNLSKKVKDDIAKQFYKHLDKYNYDASVQVMHILHFEFGFGEKRLKRFAELLNQMQQEQKERYELENEDTPWICEEQLRQSGIDFKKLTSGD